MTKPESNDCDINARLQQVHCGRVPEGMWRDTLTGKARALASGGLHGPSQTVGNRRPRQRATR